MKNHQSEQELSKFIQTVHCSWQPIVKSALLEMDNSYLNNLNTSETWLPGMAKLFNAFSIPLDETQYILFGESPYPRKESANGYAFWDAAVSSLWSDTGLSTRVNRATSLRNFMKMLLIAKGDLIATDLSQDAIAAVNKTALVTEIKELFQNLLSHGFLLLNASLVLSHDSVNKDAKEWRPFIASLLEQIEKVRPDIELIFFGNIAKKINKLYASRLPQLQVEHPYNHSFPTNPEVLSFFKPFDLLRKNTANA